MIVFFDPSSYTFHFNNKLCLGKEVVSLYNKEFETNILKKVFYFLFYYITLVKLTIGGKVKLVIFNISPLPIFDLLFLLYLKLMNIKLFIILHNLDPSKGGKYPLRKIGFFLSLNFFSKIIVNSLSKSVFEDFSYLLKFQSRIFQTNLPFNKDLNIVCKAKNNLDVLNFLFVGRIDYYKGLDRFLNFFNHLDKKANLKIIGKQDINIDNIINDLAKLPMLNLDVKNEYVSDSEYYDFLSEADIVLLPYRSCSGSAVLTDCISYGKIVIAQELDYFLEIRNSYSRIIVIDFEITNFNDLSINLDDKKFSNFVIQKFVSFDEYWFNLII